MNQPGRPGLDAVDVALHLTATGSLVAGFAVSFAVDHPLPLIPAGILCASLILLAIRRAFVRKSAAPAGLTTGEMAAERIAELEQRVADLETAQARVYELEERLDFAERLLARGPEERQAAGRDALPR